MLPRFVGFSDEFPPLTRLAASGYRVDHRMLAGLPREAFEAEARWIQETLSDSVLSAALSVLPPEYAVLEHDRLLRTLKARRAQLDRVAGEFYEILSETVHVHGFDGVVDTVRLETFADGQIRVRLWTEGQGDAPRFDRTLTTDLTKELRLYIDPETDRVEQPDDFPVTVTLAPIGEEDDEERDY